MTSKENYHAYKDRHKAKRLLADNSNQNQHSSPLIPEIYQQQSFTSKQLLDLRSRIVMEFIEKEGKA